MTCGNQKRPKVYNISPWEATLHKSKPSPGIQIKTHGIIRVTWWINGLKAVLANDIVSLPQDVIKNYETKLIFLPLV